ncbi:putative minor capsid protein [Alkalibacillus sp. S2W]|uniref:putative minor capsid protein n=1 Tax=Alkalibacillus sp. S2W TaxID=3386553 RepID=UPI00398C952C
MPSIRPIPKMLLKDSIQYQSKNSNDGWDDSYSDKQTINNVRVEPVSSMNRSGDSEGKQANDVVYIDYKNSSYFPIDAKPGDLVNEREVTRVNVLKAFKETPHHLELEVI